MEITTHILTKNNEKTIKACIDSILPLNSTILIGDLGSTDDTLSICQDLKIININNDDYSKIRNDLVESTTTDWQFYINPWETLQSGHEQLLWALTQNYNNYNIYNIQGDILTKETRVWKKSAGIKFTRPVYENLDFPTNKLINCFISGSNYVDQTELLKKWHKKEPHIANVEYYIACNELFLGNYDKFLAHAENFLFKTTTSNIMINYYIAVVQLHYKKDMSLTIKHLLYCLANEPTMAEFWCLLGDCFVKLKQWHRATAFYENAIIMGSKRLSDDPYPIEIKKYKEYPEEKLNLCKFMTTHV